MLDGESPQSNIPQLLLLHFPGIQTPKLISTGMAAILGQVQLWPFPEMGTLMAQEDGSGLELHSGSLRHYQDIEVSTYWFFQLGSVWVCFEMLCTNETFQIENQLKWRHLADKKRAPWSPVFSKEPSYTHGLFTHEVTMQVETEGPWYPSQLEAMHGRKCRGFEGHTSWI